MRVDGGDFTGGLNASMKVPARRQGNRDAPEANRSWPLRLNESPRPKAKKSESRSFKHTGTACASMKVPTRRWRNQRPSSPLRLRR